MAPTGAASLHTPLSGEADFALREPSGVALPRLVALAWPD
jgi:hypothetical protein